MIYLSTTQSCEVIATFEEKASLTTSYYTWVIYNKDSHLTFTFSCENHSTSDYYDAFTFSIGSNSLTGSSVAIDIPQGTYDYKVYQMTNQWDLNISNAVCEVENGILTVEGTYSVITEYTGDSTIKIYNNI